MIEPAVLKHPRVLWNMRDYRFNSTPNSFLLHTHSPSVTKHSFKSKANAYSQTVSKYLCRCTARFRQFPMPPSRLPLGYTVLPSRSGFYPFWRLPLLWGKALSPTIQDLVLGTWQHLCCCCVSIFSEVNRVLLCWLYFWHQKSSNKEYSPFSSVRNVANVLWGLVLCSSIHTPRRVICFSEMMGPSEAAYT